MAKARNLAPAQLGALGELKRLRGIDDAEADPRAPLGLTPALWRRIKAHFVRETPRLLEAPRAL